MFIFTLSNISHSRGPTASAKSLSLSLESECFSSLASVVHCRHRMVSRSAIECTAVTGWCQRVPSSALPSQDGVKECHRVTNVVILSTVLEYQYWNNQQV